MSKSNIPLPNKVYFAKDEGTKSVVVIEPLYPGYGMTVGNALRRVLLSSLPGAAVTAVKFKGVDHEFSTVPNVTEDVVDIILNLKQLRLRVNSEEPVRLTLSAKASPEVMKRYEELGRQARRELVGKLYPAELLDRVEKALADRRAKSSGKTKKS